MTDDLERLLAPPDTGARADVLAATTRIVSRKAALRKVRKGVLIAALLPVGVAAGWFAKPERIEREFVYLPAPAVPAIEPAPKPSPEPVLMAMAPAELEVKAELADDRTEVARLYREAGDKYLSDERDYTQAARCYRLFLNAANDDTRKVSSADSWLLISLKTQSP